MDGWVTEEPNVQNTKDKEYFITNKMFQIERLWTSGIKNFIKKRLNATYERGHKDGYEQCKIDTLEGIKAIPQEELDKSNPYISGMECAWMMANRVYLMTLQELNKAFGTERREEIYAMHPKKVYEAIKNYDTTPKPKTNWDKFIEVFGVTDFIGAPYDENTDVIGRTQDWWNEPYVEMTTTREK